MRIPNGRHFRMLFLLIVVFALPRAAFSVNYVTNGYFDSNLDGWSNELPGANRPVSWASLDANGYSGSGSLHMGATDSTASQGALMTQCAAVPGGLPYDLVLRYHITPGQGVQGYAYAGIRFYDQPACGGSEVGGRYNTWSDAASSFGFASLIRVYAPSSTKSFKIVLTVQKAAGPSFAAEFDDVGLFPVNGTENGNLLVNPHFDQSATGWTVLNGSSGASVSVSFTEFDGGGSTTPRAAVLTNTSSDTTSEGPVLTQCVGVTPGVSYDLGAKLFVPAGQTRHGSVRAFAGFFPSEGCSGTLLAYDGPFEVNSATGRYAPKAATIVAPSGARSAQFRIQLVKNDAGGSFAAWADDAWFATSGACVPGETNLCLNKDRFRVSARYETPAGASGDAHVVQLTADSGYLWFFNESNIEAIVKVLDGCGLNVHYWGFAGGLTNVKVTTTITDTLSGQTKTYTNNQNAPFQPLQDTLAFSTCP